MASLIFCSFAQINPNANHKQASTKKNDISFYNSISYHPQRGISKDLHLTHEDDYMENIKKVRNMLCSGEDSFESLVTIDALQRLGIDYHFEEEIRNILTSVYNNIGGVHNDKGDVFKKFVNQEGNFELSPKEDVGGMLELYEASYLNIGEDILDKAKDFSGQYLKDMMKHSEERQTWEHISHTLKYPFHTSVIRHHSEYHLNRYRGGSCMNKALEELASLDLNMVRSLHQKEVQAVSRWWKDLGLAQELKFARDEPLKWFMWPMVALPDPRFSRCRIEITKPIALLYIIDDIFDVCGSLDELILFTQAINRWDTTMIDSLPRYMKICYMSLYNITNEIAYYVFKEHGWNPIGSIQRADENQDGFDGSYLEYYLKENPNLSSENGRKHVKRMISDAWKGLNKECFFPEPFSRCFAQANLNGARMVRVMYDYDGDHRLLDHKKQVDSLRN
ncbi:putative terpene synthase 4 [Acorus gramineus]|uniref:Terpene synthase 4 n=1 Tax=Acorus gramineus TaxID=55184 RepID=A0AAV9AWF2_ACOGR|nr:putative terpene synthase 4 [Acorus gramineus]